jgi:hypothetical protein
MMLVFVGRFGGAGLRRLAASPLRGGPIALLACLAQVMSVMTQQHRLALLLLTCVLLAVFCWLNWRRAGVLLAMTGVALNMLVMIANGGVMPMNPTALARMNGFDVTPGTYLQVTKNQVLHDTNARLPWLGDRLLLPGPASRLAVWSLGDVLLLSGVAMFLWKTMKGVRDDPGYVRAEAPSC